MRIEWLVEVIIRTLFQRQGTFRRLPYLRQQNRRGPNVDLAQTTQSLASIHAWHEYVKDDQFWMMCLCFFEGTHTIRNNQHMKTGTLKKWCEAICDSGVVISEENGGAVKGH